MPKKYRCPDGFRIGAWVEMSSVSKKRGKPQNVLHFERAGNCAAAEEIESAKIACRRGKTIGLRHACGKLVAKRGQSTLIESTILAGY